MEKGLMEKWAAIAGFLVLHCLAANAGREELPPQWLKDPPMSIQEFLQVRAADEKPRIVAHRGFSGAAPENTMASFRLAILAEADMVELDVNLSKDGEVIVLHDDTLDRTTTGQGPPNQLMFEEIKKLDAGSWYDAKFAGEPIPTLAEVLDLVKGRILLDIEIKSSAVTDKIEGGIAEKVARLVAERDMRDAVIITSFDHRALVQMKQIDPEIKTGTLYNRDSHESLAPMSIMKEAGSDAFILSKTQITSDVVKDCHENGRAVCVYTINDMTTMQFMISLGVDAIITNQPDALKNLIK